MLLRHVRPALIVTLCWLMPGYAQDPARLEKSTTEVAPGVYVFGNYSARSLFVVTGDGVIATDPTNPGHAAAMRDAIATVTEEPVRWVVYSHQHWDHVLGGKIFKDAGATFISHEKCLPHWRRLPHPDLVLPDRTYADSTELKAGDKTLKLLYFGVNHGDCMFVMQVAGTDVMFVNDLVTPHSVGLGFMPDYDPGGWARALREIEARPDWSRMVGGHGVPVAPRAALVQRRRYLEAVMSAVREGVDKGLRGEALYDTIELAPEFREMNGYEAQLRRAAERIYYYYLMGW